MKKHEGEIEQNKKNASAIARYETIFAVTSVGIGITDETGRLIECNEAFEEMLGYGRDELYGRSIQDFNHPDDIHREEETVFNLTERNSQARLEKRFIK